MRKIIALTIILLFPIYGIAGTTVKLKEAIVLGKTIKIGQSADIVQSRIKADKFIISGYNYGDLSKGYYTDKGITYIITYGPPKKVSGGYVVISIEKGAK